MTNSNRPVYRYPPRSHAYSCRCDRCAQFYSQRSASSDLITFDMGCLGVLLAFGAVSAIGGWVAANHSAILSALPVVGAGVVILCAVICAVVLLNRRAVRPPKGRLRVEAVPEYASPSLPLAPQPPACQHLNAVMVLNFTEDEILAWLCPHCDTELPEDFGKVRRPCCGTPHGLWHLDNCPHYREWRDITGQWPS